MLLAVIGFVIANMRERLTEIALGWFAPDLQPTIDEELGKASERARFAADPISYVVEHDLVLWAALGVLAVLLVVVLLFWVSWRMRTFRVTPDVLEVRGGIIFRSHRSARLDRVQGIDITRPFVPRLFGAAKVQVSVAGQSGNTELAYLSSRAADELRRDLLVLASGARLRVSAGPVGPTPQAGASSLSDLLARRADELLAPELDPALAAPESVVQLPVGRLIGSTLLGGFVILIPVLAAVIVWGIVARTGWVLVSLLPSTIAIGSYLWARIVKSLRYSIAGTPDGVRIGYGLLSTENRTIPPGRIHAIEVHQWALWRPFGWWAIRVNIAGHVGEASGADQRSRLLPVGNADDVRRVIGLIAPGASVDALLRLGMAGRRTAGSAPRQAAPYSTPSRRARWVRPFTWRRNGWAIADGVLAFRRGLLLRRVVFVPLARLQSVAVNTGPVGRGLRLATTRVHTVAGPVVPALPALDRRAADELFEQVIRDATAYAAADHTAAWGRNG